MLLLLGKRGTFTKVINKASTPRSYNTLTEQATAYTRNRRHLGDTQGEWKEQSSNDGINYGVEDDQAAGHPGAILQTESPVAASHT